MKPFRLTARIISCALIALGNSVIAAEAQPKPYQHTCVLVVKRILDTDQAITELKEYPGVERVVRKAYTKTLTIQLKNPDSFATPSARAIWDIAERNKLEPSRLVMADGIYTSRPSTNANTKSKSNANANATSKLNRESKLKSKSESPVEPFAQVRDVPRSKPTNSTKLKNSPPTRP